MLIEELDKNHKEMAEKPIIILGAGATKACGGPLTNEILPAGTLQASAFVHCSETVSTGIPRVLKAGSMR
jgi:hypothetical protein